MREIIEEELKDLPQEGVVLLNTMPEIKSQFIRDKKVNRGEMISPYFFSYFMDDYMRCEPFFLSFEKGQEVFDNLYELYGKSKSKEPADKSPDENKLNKLLVRHIDGMNYLLKIADETTYAIHEMEIKELSEEDFEDEYDPEDIEDADIRRCCSQVMRHKILPDEDENPI